MMLETPAGAASGHDTAPAPRVRVTDTAALGMLFAYFLAQFLVRVTAPGSLELDEGLELVRAQRFALGYGDQPPLYTWLLVPFFHGFGPSVWPLALVKQSLLLGTHACVYASGRLIGLTPTAALAASAAMLWLPQIGWESQRDLTHSVLVTFVAAATLLLALRILRSRLWWQGPVLGLLVATGLMAKYNFALFVLALALAALSIPRFRQQLRPADVVAAGVVAVLVSLPHAHWVLNHMAAAMGDSLHKLDPNDGVSLWPTIQALAVGLLAFHVLLLAFLPALVLKPRPGRRRVSPTAAEGRRLLAVFLGVAVGCLVVVAVALGADHMKARWLQPLFFASPLAVVAFLDFAPMNPWGRRGAVGLLVLAPLLLLAGRAADIHASAALGHPTRFAVPFTTLLRDLPPPRDATVFVADFHLAGALRLHRPDLRLVLPEAPLPALPNDCHLMWSDAKERWLRDARAWLAGIFPDPVLATAIGGAQVRSHPFPGDGGYRLFIATIDCRTARTGGVPR